MHSQMRCDVCGKTVRNMLRHQENAHSPGRLSNSKLLRTPCADPNCDKEFSNAYAAKYHFQRVHRGLTKVREAFLIFFLFSNYHSFFIEKRVMSEM